MKVRVRLKSKILKNLGSRVKELRNKQGITQEELAYLAGVDSSYIGGIEIGRKKSFYLLSLFNCCRIKS